MSTSGSVDYQSTRTNFIETALKLCGVLREGVSASANQLADGVHALNIIMKSFHSHGMPLWAIRESAVFPIEDVNTVTLGPSGGHAATTYAATYLTAAAASGATALTVNSITGISNSDQLGVELNSGDIDWTTVSGAPSGTTVTAAVALTAAAAVNNRVYAYTTKTVKPLKIIQAALYNYDTTTQVPVNIISRDEYERLSDITVEGPPNQIYYIPGVLTGTLKFYPRFPDGSSVIKIWFQRPFEDMDAVGDTADFPQEWENAITWELAAHLGMAYNVPVRKMNMILQKAQFELAKVNDFGMEEGSVFIQPALR